MSFILLLWKVLLTIIGAVVKHLLPLWKDLQSLSKGLPHSRKVRPKFPMNLKETAKVKAENKKAQEFIEVLHVAVEQGFSAWAVFVHAWHETGAFKYVIGSHNYWGIKTPREWTGKVVPGVKTHEYVGGERTPKVDDFIDFDTALEAMGWYCNFIRRLYPNAYNNRHEPVKYFEGLINGKLKYATALKPAYDHRLISLHKVLKTDINISYLIDNV